MKKKMKRKIKQAYLAGYNEGFDKGVDYALEATTSAKLYKSTKAMGEALNDIVERLNGKG